MKTGTVWTAHCAHCGNRSSWQEVWQDDAPTEDANHTADCCDAVCFKGAARIAAWEKSVVRPLGYMRITGFSTSESDFTPHFNRAFGKRVGSLAEMKALQAQHGVSDAVVKGDGADRHAPRDIGRRVRRYEDLSANPEKYGATFTAPDEEPTR